MGKFRDKHPRDWIEQSLITFKEATEVYMVKVIAASHGLRSQLLSCNYATRLLLWLGKKVVNSWNSPSCAWP